MKTPFLFITLSIFMPFPLIILSTKDSPKSLAIKKANVPDKKNPIKLNNNPCRGPNKLPPTIVISMAGITIISGFNANIITNTNFDKAP
ncbi:hypothetical protein SDC9_164148 [bioreactor metagenome]|uniref:Uncharacterized protein n=1 Tax=bioreactor metagenome TaxID=1076179 RepID=A0A645FQW2_9ZZZZ